MPFFELLIAGARGIAVWMRASKAGCWLDGVAATLFPGLGLRMLAGAAR